MDYSDDLYDRAANFANEHDIKQLTDDQISIVLILGITTLKEFSNLTDEEVLAASKVIPRLKDIMDATMNNVRLLTKEQTLRSLPMN